MKGYKSNKPRRIAIISDIHSNLTALKAVFSYFDNYPVDDIYCLGDIVGYGAASSECVDLIRQHNVYCIQGNHDAQVREPRDPYMRYEAIKGLELAENQLSRENKNWLAELPCQKIDQKIGAVFVHGTVASRDDYIFYSYSIETNLGALNRMGQNYRICFFGHSHLAMVLTANQHNK